MNQPEPISVTDLFNPMLEALIQLLQDLAVDEWSRPTVCAGWSVKDVALHLLAVDISNLSRKRDGHSLKPEKPIRSQQDLLVFINSLNESWMQAAQRISTPLLIDLLDFVGKQVNAYFTSLDPFESGDCVSWAGPAPAPIWLDLAREYTERWHHQQHIRDAVGKPGLKEPRFFAPILDAFIRALPFTFQDVLVPDDTRITLKITGESGGTWTIQRKSANWELYVGTMRPVAAQVTIGQDDAWRLFSKGVDPSKVRGRSTLEGDPILGEKVFQMVSIIA